MAFFRTRGHFFPIEIFSFVSYFLKLVFFCKNLLKTTGNSYLYYFLCSQESLLEAKQLGFCDRQIAELVLSTEMAVR